MTSTRRGWWVAGLVVVLAGVPEAAKVENRNSKSETRGKPAYAEATAGKPADAEAAAGSPTYAKATVGKPRLILLLVVDQMRGDYLERFRERFGTEGFARLARAGAWFVNCHFPYAGTLTAPGYATLATGATPNRHGIVGNNWFDWETKRRRTAVYDGGHALVSAAKTVGTPQNYPGQRQCGSRSSDPPQAGAPAGKRGAGWGLAASGFEQPDARTKHRTAQNERRKASSEAEASEPQGLKPQSLTASYVTAKAVTRPDRLAAGRQQRQSQPAAAGGSAGGRGGASPCQLMMNTLGDELKRALQGGETRENRKGKIEKGKQEAAVAVIAETPNWENGPQGVKPKKSFEGAYGRVETPPRQNNSGEAKVYGVSWKDRAAILSSGKRADGAFWFDRQAGGFVTSTYYMERLPGWLAEFNRSEVKAYAGRKWAAGGKTLVALADPKENPASYYRELAYTPFANELLAELGERLIGEEGLGADEVTDLLALSFSANDYVGHRWGPDSAAVEEVTVASDRLLARLLKFLDAQVGAGNYWVALSSDHGVAPTLAQARARGLPAKDISPQELLGTIVAALERRWGKGAWLVPRAGGIIFNRATLAQKGVPLSAAVQVAGEAAVTVEGVMGYAGSGANGKLAAGGLPEGYAEAFELSQYPGRVADLRLLLEPFALLGFARGETTHGTPHSYDTHVPLILFGAAFRAGVYTARVTPADLVPTLAAALGIRAPAGATGRVLREALRREEPEEAKEAEEAEKTLRRRAAKGNLPEAAACWLRLLRLRSPGRAQGKPVRPNQSLSDANRRDATRSGAMPPPSTRMPTPVTPFVDGRLR